MVELSKTRDSIAVVNDQTGGPTCARDIALACISIAKQLMLEPNKTGIYHYCGQPDVSWSEFAETIFKELGCQTIVQPIPTSKYQTRALRPINSRLDCKVTERVFGISRPFWLVGLKQILKELESGYD